MIIVEKVSTEAIPVIRLLAKITWAVAYKEILSPEQLQYMLELIYSESALQKQIKEQQHQFILAKDTETNESVGFASYSIKNTIEPQTFRLHKLYVDPGQQGKGTGKILLDFIIADIKTADADTLELNVNRYNKALSFYQKTGFHIIREEDIDIGSGYFMNDYVMELPVK